MQGSGKRGPVSLTKLLSLHKYCQSELSEFSGPIGVVKNINYFRLWTHYRNMFWGGRCWDFLLSFLEACRSSVEGRKTPLSLKELGNQRCCCCSQPPLPACPDIKFLCCTLSRGVPSGLPSLAAASFLILPRGFSSKFQAPHNNSMTLINGAQERGHTSSSAQHQWPLEQPTHKLRL